MPKRIIAVKNLPHDEWLKIRKNYIGGSDAAAIIGLNDWSSPYRVWADKTGRLPAKEDNEAMRLGRDLEEYVAQRWCEETGKRTRRAPYMLRHDEYEFAAVNLDRIVIGEKAFLECKTTSTLNNKIFKRGEYPANYYVQCMHGLAVTGYERAYLAVLVYGRGLYTFTIERDEDEIAALMAQESEFWRYVQTNTPPPADGFDATTDAIKAIYEGNGSDMMLFGRDRLMDSYCELKALKDDTEKEMEKIKQTIMLDMGDAETAISNKYKVSWKKSSRSTFDAKSFIDDNPEMDLSDYYTNSAYRRFNITKAGGNE